MKYGHLLSLTILATSISGLASNAGASDRQEIGSDNYQLPAPGRDNRRVTKYKYPAKPAASSSEKYDGREAFSSSREYDNHESHSSNSNIYGGFELGYAMADFDNSDGLATPAEEYGYGSIYLGYYFTPRISAEISYFSTTESSENDPTFNVDNDFRIDGVALDGVYHHPIDSDISLLGSLGVGYYTVHAKFGEASADAPADESSEDDLAFRGGVGAEYALTSSLSSRLMLRYSYVDSEDDLNTFQAGLGLNYKF